RITGNLAIMVVYERDMPGQVCLHNADEDLIDDGAKSLLAFTHGLLGLTALASCSSRIHAVFQVKRNFLLHRFLHNRSLIFDIASSINVAPTSPANNTLFGMAYLFRMEYSFGMEYSYYQLDTYFYLGIRTYLFTRNCFINFTLIINTFSSVFKEFEIEFAQRRGNYALDKTALFL
ncbi:MAG: hypothetical protein WA435_00025, partial [Gallionellaceae bacterium]